MFVCVNKCWRKRKFGVLIILFRMMGSSLLFGRYMLFINNFNNVMMKFDYF